MIESFWKLKQFTVLDTQQTIQCGHIFYGITKVVTKYQSNLKYDAFGTLPEYKDCETSLV